MVSQILANGLVAGSVYALVALGFAIIYRVGRFFHFTHGVVFALGAYFAFSFTVLLGIPFAFSALFAIGLGALCGCLMELSVYRSLRGRGASSLVLLLASLGMYFLLQNAISLAFGDDIKTIYVGAVREGFNVLGARITPIQIATVCASAALILVVGSSFEGTRLGTIYRAVADDPELARLCGIASDQVILAAFAVGSSLAAIAGILVALDVHVTPNMGMNPLMMAMVAVVIGGVESIPGLAIGALLLGMAQQLGAWAIGSQWQDAIAFVILLAFLLFRPEGFLGGQLKKATV